MSKSEEKQKRKFTPPPKSLLGLGEDVTFSIGGVFTLMLASFGLFINLLLAYIFFLKLLLNKKNLTKTRKAVTILILVLTMNIFINELGVYVLNGVLNVSLIIVNIIMFLVILYINKIVKARLLKKDIKDN